jgi:hypothetical protein
MFGPEFASCWLKLGRAEEHADSLKTGLLAWKNSNPYVVSRKASADGSRHSIVLNDIKNPAPLDQWAVIFGDFVHNLRACLDHFTYACAVHETGENPPDDEGKLQFPIYDCPAVFAEKAWRIRSLSAGMRAAIEGVQPYKRGHATHSPLLALLAEFDNTDKHRLLSIVVSQQSGGELNFTLPPGTRIANTHFAGGPLERGTELVWFTVDPPQPSVDYKHSAEVVITVGHLPGPSGDGRTELPVILDYLKAEVRLVITTLGHHLSK